MRLEQLNYLTAVVQCGSFNKAAQKLSVSQPAVSSAIKALENELQVPLLERSKSGAVPTDYGLEIIREYLVMGRKMDQWKYLNPENRSEIVRLYYFTEFCSRPLYQLFLMMQKTHPEIDLRLSTNRKTLTEINTNEAILHTCSSDKLDKYLYNTESQYEVTHLYQEQFCLYVGNCHKLASQKTVAMEDLRNIAVAGKDHRKGFPFRDTLNELGCRMIYLGSNENIMRAISSGLAVSILPESLAIDNLYVETGMIIPIKIADADYKMYHYMLTPLGREMNRYEHIVADALVKNYKKLMEG